MLEGVQPVLDLGERLSGQVVAPLAPHLLITHQGRSPQHLQVLGDRGTAQVELLGEVSGDPRTLGEDL